jgi:hypothetical protein
MHSSIPACTPQLSKSLGVVAVILVDLRSRHSRMSMASSDAGRVQFGCAQRVDKPRRQRVSLDANNRGQSCVGPDRLRENTWGGRALAAPNLPSARIDDEEMGQNLRFIQTDKHLHCASPDV